MRILNLGCGTKASPSPSVVNIDWSITLRLRTSPLLRPLVPALVRGDRRARFEALPDNILVHDLSRGIPFGDGTVDAVFHSHMLEHLDREVVPHFLAEVRRVLRPGGIHRIAVPDLEAICRAYLSHADTCRNQPAARALHEEHIRELLEQSVRKESSGTSQQAPLRRFVENAVLGDARERGETHQWMYDEHNLGYLLEQAGYQPARRCSCNESAIEGWAELGLELDEQGEEYKRGSLYLEAVR